MAYKLELHYVKSVAYKLELHPSSRIHIIFHVSFLKKVISEKILV